MTRYQVDFDNALRAEVVKQPDPGVFVYGTGEDGPVTINADQDQQGQINATTFELTNGILRSNGQVIYATDSITVDEDTLIAAIGGNGGNGGGAGGPYVDYIQGLGALPGAPGAPPLSDGFHCGSGAAGAIGEYGYSHAVDRIFPGEDITDPYVVSAGNKGGKGGACSAIDGGLGGQVTSSRRYGVPLQEPCAPPVCKSAWDTIQEKYWQLDRDFETTNVGVLKRIDIATRGGTYLEIDATVAGEQLADGAWRADLLVDGVSVWSSGNDVLTNSASHMRGKPALIPVTAGAHYVEFRMVEVSPPGTTLECHAATNAEHAASLYVREIQLNPVISTGGPGGGGGSGGADAIGPGGGGGGAGGGLVILAAPVVTIAGSVSVQGGEGGNGGDGSSSPGTNAGGGGGGSGGAGGLILIFAETFNLTGTITKSGGTGGTGGVPKGSGTVGQDGAAGSPGKAFWINTGTGVVTAL